MYLKVCSIAVVSGAESIDDSDDSEESYITDESNDKDGDIGHSDSDDEVDENEDNESDEKIGDHQKRKSKFQEQSRQRDDVGLNGVGEELLKVVEKHLPAAAGL